MTPDLLAEAERLTFAEETWAADGVTFSDREMTQLRSMMSTLAGGMAAAKSASSSDDDDEVSARIHFHFVCSAVFKWWESDDAFAAALFILCQKVGVG